MKKIILKLDNVFVKYGSIEVIHGVSFEIAQGEILTLIGSNGAGKTTILKAISGLLRPSSGQILHHGESLHNFEPHQIVRRKVCQVPEGRGIFLNLSVEENLDLGAYSLDDKSTYKNDLEHAFQLFPRLKERRSQNAGTLSGGEQQMLAIARGLMAHPEILLLDEPSLGLAPQIIETIFSIIKKINAEGKTILLVEQNALQALQVAHHGIVLETGHVSVKGSAKELLNSETVKRAYLGFS